MQPKRIAIIGANWPAYELYCPNFTGMQQGLATMGIEHQLFSCRPVLNVDALIAYEPDFIIYGLIDMVKTFENRMKIRRSLPKAKIIMWYGDLRDGKTNQIDGNMSEIDMMFVSNDAQQDFYKRKWKVPDCQFLPLGSPVWDRPYESKWDFPFVFIGGLITGAAFMDRARLMWRFKDNGLRVLDGSMRNPLLRAKIMKKVPTIYRSSKIVLDVSHFTDIKGYTSNRFWIITGAGGFALTKRWPGCTDFYPEGTRAYFDTFEEALSLRDYYLAHPDEREKIRKAGHIHAQNHTYDKRFAIMFEKVYGSTQNKIDTSRLSPKHKALSP